MRNDYVDVDDDDDGDWYLNYQRAKLSNQIDGTFLSKTFLFCRFDFQDFRTANKKVEEKNADFVLIYSFNQLNSFITINSFIK